jgi:hypothetical protein
MYKYVLKLKKILFLNYSWVKKYHNENWKILWIYCENIKSKPKRLS